jgi:hypothetical protein
MTYLKREFLWESIASSNYPRPGDVGFKLLVSSNISYEKNKHFWIKLSNRNKELKGPDCDTLTSKVLKYIIVIIIIIIIIIFIKMYLGTGLFLPGISLEPAVIPNVQSSSFTCSTFRIMCDVTSKVEYYYYYYHHIIINISWHRPFLPGTYVEPAVIPTAHSSSFTLQYFPYYV